MPYDARDAPALMEHPLCLGLGLSPSSAGHHEAGNPVARWWDLFARSPLGKSLSKPRVPSPSSGQVRCVYRREFWNHWLLTSKRLRRSTGLAGKNLGLAGPALHPACLISLAPPLTCVLTPAKSISFDVMPVTWRRRLKVAIIIKSAPCLRGTRQIMVRLRPIIPVPATVADLVRDRARCKSQPRHPIKSTTLDVVPNFNTCPLPIRAVSTWPWPGVDALWHSFLLFIW